LECSYTFVKPIHAEQGVGDRTAYGHIMTMSGCIAWTLFALPSFKDNIWTVIINGTGIPLELTYVCFFMYHAANEARRLPMYLLVGVLSVSGFVTGLFVEMVLIREVWERTFMGVIASILTGLSYIFVLVDVVSIAKTLHLTSVHIDPCLLHYLHGY
jgi:hypothetical protein